MAATTGRASAPRASASSELTPTVGNPRACASARAVAIPIRSPVKLPGPSADREPLDVAPPHARRRQRLAGGGEQPRRVGRPRTRRGVVADFEDRIVNKNARHRRRGRGIEPQHDHEVSTLASPPACASATCRTTCRSPSSASSPRRSGHSTNVISSGPK